MRRVVGLGWFRLVWTAVDSTCLDGPSGSDRTAYPAAEKKRVSLFGPAIKGFALDLVHDFSFVPRSASNLSWVSPEPPLGRSGLNLALDLVPASSFLARFATNLGTKPSSEPHVRQCGLCFGVTS